MFTTCICRFLAIANPLMSPDIAKICIRHINGQDDEHPDSIIGAMSIRMEDSAQSRRAQIKRPSVEGRNRRSLTPPTGEGRGHGMTP